MRIIVFSLCPLRTNRLFWITLALLIVAVPFEAQQTPNASSGFKPGNLYDIAGLDQVSLFSGVLSLGIPIGQPYAAGGGFSYQLGLQYHSTLWDSHTYSSPCPTPSECPLEYQPKQSHEAGLGWHLTLPEIIPPVNFWNQTEHWIYVSSGGGEHILYSQLHGPGEEDPSDVGVVPANQRVLYSRDGSYLRARRTSQSATKWTVELPGGEIHTFNRSGDEWRLSRMEDRFGNGVDVTYGTDGNGNEQWTLDDGFRLHRITYFDPGAGFPHQRRLISKIELAAFDGGTATYNFNYGTKTVDRPPGHNHTLDRTVNAWFLQSVSLPDGSAFTMGTVASPAYQADGMLTQLRLPTLGFLEWDWQRFSFPKFRSQSPVNEGDEAVEPWNSVVGVARRRQKNIAGATLGEWTYARALDSTDDHGTRLPEKLTVTVRRPLGDKSEHFFSVYPALELIAQPSPQWGTRFNEYSLPYTRSEQDPGPAGDPDPGNRFLSSRVYDCDEDGGSCSLVRSVYVSYELDNDINLNDQTGVAFNKNRRLRSQRIVDHYREGNQDRTHWRLDVFSDFDGLGHYRNSTTYSDYGPTRTRRTTYNPDRGTYPVNYHHLPSTSAWLTSLFDSEETTENGVTSQKEFCFSRSTGFLHRARVLKNSNGTRSMDDIVRVFNSDAIGQIGSETWHGGDTTSVGTGELCGLGLGASSYRLVHTYQFGVRKTSRYTFDGGGIGNELSFFNLEHTNLDRNTGLPEATRSPSGVVTSFDYDTLGRLRFVKPEASSGAAWTKIFYGTAQNASTMARAEIRELPNGQVSNTPALSERRVVYDGLGRMRREQEMLPGGVLTSRFRFYDEEGRESAVSNWGTGSALGFSSQTDHDAFNRPRMVFPHDATPDNPEHAVSLAYEGFAKVIRTVMIGTAVDGDGAVVETPVSRTDEYDVYSRQIAVTEGSGSGGAAVRTTYAYDVENRLIRVSMPIGGGQSQERSWKYDQRGFLNSECHPEKGTSGGGCTSYGEYDPMGKARLAIDGPHIRRYSYDRAGRLTFVRDNAHRLAKKFVYGRSSSATNKANAQVVQAVNYHYPVLPEGMLEQQFIEDFTYGGTAGARSARTVTWVRQCAAGDPDPDCADDGFCTEDSFTHAETLNARGVTESISYPVCVGSDSGCGSAQPRTVTYSYAGGSGYLTGVPGWASLLEYHNNRTLKAVHHGNGVIDRIAQDPNGSSRPRALTVEVGGQTVWESGTLRFDGAGNLVELAGPNFTDRYLYDPVSRLTASRQWIRRSSAVGPLIFADGFETGAIDNWNPPQEDDDFPVNAYTAQQFSYDIPGNLRSVTTDGEVQNHKVSTLTNRLTGSATYDGAGNLTSFTDGSGETTTLTYDVFNRLVQRIQGDKFEFYLYTADDERLLRFGNQGFRWSLRDFLGQVLREFTTTPGGTLATRDHIYRGRGLLATVTPDGAGALSVATHMSLDHLGTPRYLTDQAGDPVSEHVYYPFGREATDRTQDSHPLKFTGHERDFNGAGEADDLDYMHARYCDPQMGRFLSVDPVLGHEAEPQSWNRYAYARNNPMVLTDPTGRYVTNCAEGDGNCAEDARQFEIARQELLNHKDPDVAAAAAVFGDPDEENGILVEFAVIADEKTAAEAFVDVFASSETGEWIFKGVVTFRPNTRGIKLKGVIGHEGQHLVDGLGFFATFTQSPLGYDVNKNLTVFQTEMNAYRITHKIYESEQTKAISTSSTCRRCDLGFGVKTQARVDAAIRRRLADPGGNYNVTPEDQGARQARAWQN